MTIKNPRALAYAVSVCTALVALSYGASHALADRRGSGLKFDASLIEVGDLWRGAPLNVRLVATNQSERVLKILSASGGCRAFASVQDETGRHLAEVAPGQRVVIVAAVNTNDVVEGDFVRLLKVTTDASSNPATITIKGRVRSEVRASKEVIDLERSADATAMVGAADLTIAAESGVRVLSMQSTNPDVVAELQSGSGAGQHHIRVVGRVNPAQPTWLRGLLIVTTTSRHVPEVRIPLSARYVPPAMR